MEQLVAAVVLNWNGAEDTIACLESVRGSTVPVRAVVVDNGSSDDSVRRIEGSGLADAVVVLRANIGYAAGNNVGIRAALDEGAEVVAVLNNDTIVDPDAFELMLEHLPPLEPRAVSPDIRYFDRPGESWFVGGVVDDGWPRHLQPEELDGGDAALRPSEVLSGCCIVARRETWERVGLFDPRYFLIFEDSDWSMRAARSDVALYVVVRSRISHHVSRSLTSRPALLLGGYYFVRNGLHFEARYFPRRTLPFAFRWLVRAAPSLVRRGQVAELGFRWLGALAFATGRWGRAPRSVEWLARTLTARRGSPR